MISKPIIDPVHDIQRAFRVILDAFSNPGQNKILEVKNHGDDTSLSPAMHLLARMLLDAETTFFSGSDKEGTQTSYISRLCYAQQTCVNDADYILVDSSKIPDQELCSLISQAKVGSLEEPHRGATVIIEVPNLNSASDFTISGPGIQFSTKLSCGLSREVLETRNKACSAFPMGFDMLVVDLSGTVLAIPRSSKVV